MLESSSIYVKNWVDNNLPPLSWNVITMTCVKEFMSNGVSPRELKENVIYNENLLNRIDSEIRKRYQKENFLDEIRARILN